MPASVQIDLDDLTAHFDSLKSLRSNINQLHPLPGVLAIAIMAILAGAGGPTSIAGQVVDGGGDYVLALKANQKTMYQAVKEYVDEQMQDDFKSCKSRKHSTVDEGHGRKEERLYVQLPLPNIFVDQSRWKGLKTIGVVTQICQL